MNNINKNGARTAGAKVAPFLFILFIFSIVPINLRNIYNTTDLKKMVLTICNRPWDIENEDTEMRDLVMRLVNKA